MLPSQAKVVSVHVQSEPLSTYTLVVYRSGLALHIPFDHRSPFLFCAGTYYQFVPAAPSGAISQRGSKACNAWHRHPHNQRSKDRGFRSRAETIVCERQLLPEWFLIPTPAYQAPLHELLNRETNWTLTSEMRRNQQPHASVN
jgi:hypothetical protein